VINIHSKHRIAPDFCKNISLAVLFGSNGNSDIVSTPPDMCIYRHSSQYIDADRAKERKEMGQK
jgi:hypothetical protein